MKKRLKIKLGKTELILFGSQCQFSKCQSTELNACGTMISKMESSSKVSWCLDGLITKF